VKAGPPGWRPHQIDRRIDGWICDPKDETRIPAAVAQMIARAMPQPRGDTVADIRARMQARQFIYEQSKMIHHD
jgi:hypothetical protein